MSTLQKKFVKGNEAVAMAAIEAGVRCYFGYPITPQSDIPEYLSRELPKTGGTFIQVESEIGAINMVLGASATGVRAMTSSSGPGISLKQEGISYMAGSELPGVIVDIMRSGPGLGGIDASQADYHQATKGGGHGGYRIIVLAPNSVQEMYDLTMLAFDLSDQYRMPAMVLADSVLGQMKESIVPNPRPQVALPDKDWAVRGTGGGQQHVVKSLYLGDGEMETFHWKMHARYQELADKESRWEEYQTADAELVVTAFGATSRIARTAVEMARAQGHKVGLLRPITLFPFPKKAYAELSDRCKNWLTVELSTGQMVDDVRLSVARDAEVDFYGRPPGAGSLPTPEELFEQIKKRV
ncbi:MAG: 3-methyl-2-oxobutanoate dehydrogenase subunit VorB [Trichlorobacter sp.]|jgi:2-oxoglutarate ferredoxin oxidoreductase subunit alpha